MYEENELLMIKEIVDESVALVNAENKAKGEESAIKESKKPDDRAEHWKAKQKADYDLMQQRIKHMRATGKYMKYLKEQGRLQKVK